MNKPLLMGVVNTTPDSFSDGGSFGSPMAACDQIEKLLEDGADIIDLGAESTRPGAESLTSEKEWQRLEPVFNEIHKRHLRATFSIDSHKEKTVLNAIEAGASFINNVDGVFAQSFFDKLPSKEGLSYIAMHRNADAKTMQNAPLKGAEAVSHVERFFGEASQSLQAFGFDKSHIWLDPGIGFGKDDSANLRLLAETHQWTKNYQVTLGISRKSFLGRLLGIDPPKERDSASKTLELGLWLLGAQMIRTHDVKPLKNMVELITG